MARSSQYPPSVKPGIPKLPALPQGWKYYRFGEVLDVAKRQADLVDEERYQLVTAKRSRGGIVPRERLKGRDIKTKTQFFCSRDDFLISRRQIIHGACGVVPESLDGAVVSNEYSTLRVRPSLALSYLEALSHTTYFQRTCFHSSIGVDVEKMIFKIDDWLRLKVPLPPLPEQKKIAAILSSVDEAIQATQAVIEQTRRVKEGLLQDLLTRGIGHTRFKQTEIGEIPESWIFVRTPSIAAKGRHTIAGGPFGSNLTSHDYVDGPGVPVIRGNNLTYESGTFNDSHFAYVSEEKALDLRRNLAFPGDLIVTQRGTLGAVGLLPTESQFERYVVSQSQMKLTPDLTKIRPRYLWYYAGSKTVLDWVARNTIATGVPHINLGLFRSLPVPLPPLHEQDVIVERMDTLQASTDLEVEKLCSLTCVKAGLLQDLLTGRVRVSP